MKRRKKKGKERKTKKEAFDRINQELVRNMFKVYGMGRSLLSTARDTKGLY